MHNSGHRTAPTSPVRPSPATILVGRCTSAGSVRHAREKRHRTDVRTAHATPSVPKSGGQCRQGKGELPMRTTLKRKLYTLCDVLLLLAVLGLMLPPHTYGENIEPLFSEGSPTDLLGRVAGRRADACDRPLDLLEGRGIHKKCPSAGSSSGIAKGDFNGDGFADLAVGVPNKETPAGVSRSGAVIVIYGS